jgi:hypothetical protein
MYSPICTAMFAPPSPPVAAGLAAAVNHIGCSYCGVVVEHLPSHTEQEAWAPVSNKSAPGVWPTFGVWPVHESFTHCCVLLQGASHDMKERHHVVLCVLATPVARDGGAAPPRRLAKLTAVQQASVLWAITIPGQVTIYTKCCINMPLNTNTQAATVTLLRCLAPAASCPALAPHPLLAAMSQCAH